MDDQMFDRAMEELEEIACHEQKTREEGWLQGKHTDQYGKVHKITKMSDRHLRNTINYFSGYDTKPLKEELSKRK